MIITWANNLAAIKSDDKNGDFCHTRDIHYALGGKPNVRLYLLSTWAKITGPDKFLCISIQISNTHSKEEIPYYYSIGQIKGNQICFSNSR